MTDDRALLGCAVTPFRHKMSKPKINPVLLLSPVENGYVAYDPVLDRLHHLNPTAALIAELSDGDRSIETICDLVCPIMPDKKAEDVSDWIAKSIDAGLLVWADSASAKASELSAAELFNLTKRLRAAGKVQTAYLCGKRTVEQQPDNWDAWYDFGEIAQCVGRREEARAAYQKYFDMNPHDGEIEHLLIALRDETPPLRASDRAIQHIYKNFAPSYEERMVGDLKYAGPQRTLEAAKSVIGDRKDLTILDLGCGSGLTGNSFKEYAASLTGIDLSTEMIELARARGIYNQLEKAEITEWLEHDERVFDMIVSCDCLIYFGDLANIVRLASRHLRPKGILAFSVERGTHAPFHLTDTGRYNHHPDHIRDCAIGCGMEIVKINEGFLRMEYGDEVGGLYVVLRNPNKTHDKRGVGKAELQDAYSPG